MWRGRLQVKPPAGLLQWSRGEETSTGGQWRAGTGAEIPSLVTGLCQVPCGLCFDSHSHAFLRPAVPAADSPGSVCGFQGKLMASGIS